jgi:uncharacterized protein YecE (DUF72 family)
MARATIRVGISGWRYAPWRGGFYPEGLAQRRELEFASRKLPTIELNGSFYSLQRPEAYARWYGETPANFVFSVKGPRYLTHMLRLRGIDEALANFLASGLFALKEKLGPVVWQFPPNFRYDAERMHAFLELLPRDTEHALSMARRRSSWMKGRTCLQIDEPRPLRHAIEIRHPSFLVPEFVELLRRQRIALVVTESAGKWPMPQDVTAEFVYMRLHGDEELYRSGYRDEALDAWAKRVEAWHRGGEPDDADKVLPRPPPTRKPRDVYCYFDNTDVKLRAPFDAQTLMRKLGAEYVPEEAGRSRPRPPRRVRPRRTA